MPLCSTGLAHDNNDCRKGLFMLYLKFLQEGQLIAKTCTDIVGLLLLEVRFNINVKHFKCN